MKGVRAGLADRVHHASVAAELGAVGIGQGLEFPDGFHAELGTGGARAGGVTEERQKILVIDHEGLAHRP